jgi:hypothetical protein
MNGPLCKEIELETRIASSNKDKRIKDMGEYNAMLNDLKNPAKKIKRLR